jgi:hypothetical protein
VVLDENNDHVFTQQELLGAARKVVELLRQQQSTGGGAGSPSPEVAAVLDRFSRHLRENMVRAAGRGGWEGVSAWRAVCGGCAGQVWCGDVMVSGFRDAPNQLAEAFSVYLATT